MSITNDQVVSLEAHAKSIRKNIITMLAKAGTGHTAGALDMTDVFTALYFYALNHKSDEPEWEGRDRFVLSNGHIAPVLYATMAEAGYFDISKLDTLRLMGSPLQGHPHREYLPGVETSSGPLGSGLSQAVGMALADRIDNGKTSGKFFYCFMGDGETQEGQIWEAAMLAGKEQLGNLICVVDRNNIQIDKAVFEKPTMIIARTISSKGVPAWERDYTWHGKPPKPEDVDMALKAIDED